MYKIAAITLVVGVSTTAVGWMHASSARLTTPIAADAASPHRPPRSIVRGTGYIEPASELRRMVFRSEGVIQSCFVSVGQRVRGGDVLMTLANAELVAAVAVAEKELDVAKTQRNKVLSGAHEYSILAAQRTCDLMAKQSSHDKQHYERMARLLKSKAATEDDVARAESEWQCGELRLRRAKAELMQLQKTVRPEDQQLAEAQVRLAESRVESMKRQLDNTSLRAPFDGTVLEILRREGEGASRLDPVLVFADESQLRVRAEIDERYVHQLKTGLTARIHGAGLGPEFVDGKVVTVKHMMGKKSVFTHQATERKDLDVIQVLIDLPPGFSAPMGLQIDVDLDVSSDQL